MMRGVAEPWLSTLREGKGLNTDDEAMDGWVPWERRRRRMTMRKKRKRDGRRRGGRGRRRGR
jgi:hypothetical protein